MTTLALTDEQSEGSLFDRLTVLADRLIVDSAEFRSPIASMAVLSQVAHRRHQPCIPGDLNWGRLTYWRDQVAQFFDPPNSRPYLDQLDRIAIGIAAAANGAVNPAQAFLLTGWLASRLGWRPSIPDRAPASPGRNHTLIRRGADGVLRLDFQVGLRQVRLAIHPGAPDGTLPGGLSDVTLSAGRDALFRIARQDDGVHAVAEQEIPDSAPLRRTVRLEPVTPGQLLAEELGLVERDVAYDDTLRLLSNLHAMGA